MEKVLLENISVKDFGELITIFENVLKQCKATQILISNDLFNRMLKANNNSIIWGEDVLDSLHYNDKVEKAFLFYVGNDSQKQMLQMHFTGNCSDYMQLMSRKQGEFIASSPECSACEYLSICGGGCRAMSFRAYSSILRKDNETCKFFREGWLERVIETLGRVRPQAKTKLLNDNDF